MLLGAGGGAVSSGYLMPAEVGAPMLPAPALMPTLLSTAFPVACHVFVNLKAGSEGTATYFQRCCPPPSPPPTAAGLPWYLTLSPRRPPHPTWNLWPLAFFSSPRRLSSLALGQGEAEMSSGAGPGATAAVC